MASVEFFSPTAPPVAATTTEATPSTIKETNEPNAKRTKKSEQEKDRSDDDEEKLKMKTKNKRRDTLREMLRSAADSLPSDDSGAQQFQILSQMWDSIKKGPLKDVAYEQLHLADRLNSRADQVVRKWREQFDRQHFDTDYLYHPRSSERLEVLQKALVGSAEGTRIETTMNVWIQHLLSMHNDKAPGKWSREYNPFSRSSTGSGDEPGDPKLWMICFQPHRFQGRCPLDYGRSSWLDSEHRFSLQDYLSDRCDTRSDWVTFTLAKVADAFPTAEFQELVFSYLAQFVHFSFHPPTELKEWLIKSV
jgi:hypothetical protein